MDVEGARNFKELRAKFQNMPDAPLLPRPVKLPAATSQKDITSIQSTQVSANGKPFSTNQNQPSPYCSSNEPQPLTPHKMKGVQSSKAQKCANSSAPQEAPSGYTINSQRASLLSERTQSNDEITVQEIVAMAYNFRDKLQNWEKFSSQKGEMASAISVTNCGGRAFYQEKQKSMGCFPESPGKMLETNKVQTVPSQCHLTAPGKTLASSEDSSFPLLQHNTKRPEHTSLQRRPVLSTSPLTYESELDSQVTEKQQDIRHHQLPRTKSLPSVESLGPPPLKPPKPPLVNLQVFQRQAAAIHETQMEAAGKDSDLPPESAEFEDPHNYEATISYPRHSGNSVNLCTTKEIADSTYEVGIEELQKGRWLNSKQLMPSNLTVLCPEDLKLAGNSQGNCGYVEALEVTKKNPDQEAFVPSAATEEIYDDVAHSQTECTKSLSSDSFASESEENSGETYEDVYKTKCNYPKKDLDENETLKKLQQFFKKEKNKFKMKKAKLKENFSSNFSISLPDLEFRSQEVTIYDDVDIPERKSKEENKLKTWKTKFFITKENKAKKAADKSESLSPRNFFRIKKQNLEKKMEKEEKLFRERFRYDKKITVINTAVACSSNPRKGIFDLSITPGEELDVIDITEQNLVICRNSEGKYGYVLTEHLDFKHRSWSP